MEDYRNREWTDTPSVVAQREREAKKQLLKEVFKEALSEDRAQRNSGGVVISEEKFMELINRRN